MKAFIPYRIKQFNRLADNEKAYAREPNDGEWATIGLVKPDTVFPDENIMVQSDHLDLKIIERVLPSASIRRHVAEKRAEYAQVSDSKPNRTIVAQWKEEFISEHLPNAPLRETVVRVAVVKDMLFVGTSNRKLADSIVSFLHINDIVLYEDENELAAGIFSTQTRFFQDWLNAIFNGSVMQIDNLDIALGDKLKFVKNDDGKSKISITNDIEMLHGMGISGNVVELAIGVPHEISFVVNVKGQFKSVNIYMSSMENEDSADSEHQKIVSNQAAWIYTKQALAIVVKIINKFETEYNETDSEL